MGVSKVVYGGQTLIDLTADTIKPENILAGYKGHGADGEPITGTCNYDANTQEATAADSEILSGKKAVVKGEMKTGTMKNNGAVAGVISAKDGVYNVPHGYHDGSGTVQLDENEKAKLIPDNIREGITLFGVAGEMSGSEDVKAQSKEVTPATVEQVVLPDEGYNSLTQVTVKPISYVESDNSAGGKTVTIAG